MKIRRKITILSFQKKQHYNNTEETNTYNKKAGSQDIGRNVIIKNINWHEKIAGIFIFKMVDCNKNK